MYSCHFVLSCIIHSDTHDFLFPATEMFTTNGSRFESATICPQFTDFEFTKWDLDGEVSQTPVAEYGFQMSQTHFGDIPANPFFSLEN